MKQKVITPKIILSLTFLLAVVFIGYKINWSKIGILFSKTLIEFGLAPDIKTYINKEFGFQISYPGNWLILKGTGGIMWYRSDSKSELDPRIFTMSWHDPKVMYGLGVRCDKNTTCEEIDRIATSDKAVIITIWKPTEEGRKSISSEYLGFIESSDREIIPEFTTDFDDIDTFKKVLSTFKFIN